MRILPAESIRDCLHGRHLYVTATALQKHNNIGALHSLTGKGYLGILMEHLMLAICWVSDAIEERVAHTDSSVVQV